MFKEKGGKMLPSKVPSPESEVRVVLSFLERVKKSSFRSKLELTIRVEGSLLVEVVGGSAD